MRVELVNLGGAQGHDEARGHEDARRHEDARGHVDVPGEGVEGLSNLTGCDHVLL